MKNKDIVEFEEQAKSMDIEDKLKYAKLYFEMKRSMEFDWGFFFIILGLSLACFAYFMMFLIDISLIVV
jgi:hypothetical protein